jgi:Rrf2 family nitric oxide-sensitive transcriptional repressor
MLLTFSTDYALRLLMLVGLESDRLVTIEEVADRFGISKSHLMKVAYQLEQAGYLENRSGSQRRVALGKGAKPDCCGGGRSQTRTRLCGSRNDGAEVSGHDP